MGSDTKLLMVEVNVTETTATTPLAIAFLFVPLARQVTDPLLVLQLSDLPAAVSAGPAAMLRDRTSLVAKERVHCRPAGALVEEVFSDRFNETVPPRAADTEPRLNDVP